MKYKPYIGILRGLIANIEGATWEEKASKVGITPHALRRCLIFRQVTQRTANYISTALGKPLEELFWR